MSEKSLLRKAEQIGPATRRLFAKLMSGRIHPEEGFRPCLGLLRLSRDYGAAAMEAACACALETGTATYRRVKALLADTTGQLNPSESAPLLHENIRGADYYQQIPPKERQQTC